MRISYIDGGSKPATIDEMREYAESNGWTLEEFFDAVDHGVPFGKEDAYIKKQRELKSSSN